MKNLPYFWRRGLWTLLSLSFMGLLVVGVLYIYLEKQLPDIDALDDVQLQVPLRIYSEDKKLIAEYGEKRRIPVRYNAIPIQLINALLSTEDQRFFEHPGVDVYGLARATVKLIKTGRKSQGGSTITMQVARNFFLSRKKTFLRKFNEILLAIKIDNELPKEKILELYLNKIYLGNRSYGVAAAAKVYYGKKLNELTLAQMAMIAGLPQAPSSKNPIRNPKAALNRRNHVLKRMLELDKVTKIDYLNAINQPITASYHGRKIELYAPYVAEMIRLSLYKHFNKSAYDKGYKVYTTINSKHQKNANQALETAIFAYDKRHEYRGAVTNLTLPNDLNDTKELTKLLKPYKKLRSLMPAIVTHVDEKELRVFIKNNEFTTLSWHAMQWARSARSDGTLGKYPQTAQDIAAIGDVIYIRQIDNQWQLSQLPAIEAALISLAPKNGNILALSGGLNFYKSKFNRVTQAKRQPGSSIKPFIYAAALAKDFTLASLVNDAPIVIKDPGQENLWRPQNDNKKFYGPTRLRMGLIRSRNLVSIRILKTIGIPFAISYLKRFGFDENKLPKSLSLALGSLHVTPLELTGAFAILANGGFKVEPHIISRITDSQGQVILETLPQIACKFNCHNIPASQQAPQVIDSSIAYLMTSALKDVIQQGTGRRALSLKRNDLAGKTGTTNDQRDAWFAGFNGNIVTTTWMGFDTPKSLKEYASNTALPMWIDFMGNALKGTKESSLPMPANLISVRIDPITGLRTNRSDQSILEVFRKDHLPEFQEEEEQEDSLKSNEVPLPILDNLF